MSWIDVSPDLVAAAAGGDARSLETVIARTQDPVFNLALKFLWHPEDVRDATQEILIRVVTSLAGFRGESAFGTWAYRIAVNHLLNTKRSRAERNEVSFSNAANELAVLDHEALKPEEEELISQVKVACTHGMLLCLKRPYRMAFVLGTIFEMNSEEAASLLGITSQAFRQRVSRARRTMAGFLGTHCSLINQAAPCSCQKRIRPCAKTGVLRPYARLQFVEPQLNLSGEIHAVEKTAALYRTLPRSRAPESILRRIRGMLDNKLFAD